MEGREGRGGEVCLLQGTEMLHQKVLTGPTQTEIGQWAC